MKHAANKGENLFLLSQGSRIEGAMCVGRCGIGTSLRGGIEEFIGTQSASNWLSLLGKWDRFCTSIGFSLLLLISRL